MTRTLFVFLVLFLVAATVVTGWMLGGLLLRSWGVETLVRIAFTLIFINAVSIAVELFIRPKVTRS